MITHRQLRVVHVVNQLDMGGMEKLLVEFARHADRQRFQLHFLSLGKPGPLAGEIDKLGWPVTELATPPGLRPGLLFRLLRFFRQFKADVVHTHNTKPLLYAGPAGYLAGARVIHTRHGQRFNARGRETAAFRLATRLADRVVCVSRDSARLSASEGIAPSRICTVWNGIDLTRFQPVGPNREGPVIAVGRLVPVKDFSTLVHAAAFVVKEHPSFRLEIAGGGECYNELRELIEQLNLQDHVKLLGEVRDIPSLLSKGRLFVLPSLSEGISLTLLEAMAARLPIVATRVGGTPEVVDDGVTGLLVSPRSPKNLAEAILRLLDDPEISDRMGKLGRARVEANFDVRIMVGAYERLYENP